MEKWEKDLRKYLDKNTEEGVYLIAVENGTLTTNKEGFINFQVNYFKQNKETMSEEEFKEFVEAEVAGVIGEINSDEEDSEDDLTLGEAK